MDYPSWMLLVLCLAPIMALGVNMLWVFWLRGVVDRFLTRRAVDRAFSRWM